uniref:Uncharacterized protein n=1 Tax=Picea glauca TaxID=3330 RepID=A0A117NGB2_PICGL|nr:hypothetical protein ABT39_MTgene1625 [Picea glauca]QHR92131.1 hypothetical protein Q903MT_gene6168 [Picea sitchensis]
MFGRASSRDRCGEIYLNNSPDSSIPSGPLSPIRKFSRPSPSARMVAVFPPTPMQRDLWMGPPNRPRFSFNIKIRSNITGAGNPSDSATVVRSSDICPDNPPLG